MSDNTTYVTNVGATPPAGLVVATDQIAGVDYQRVKVTWGADGTANDANAATPLPVDGSNVTQPVSGTVTANIGTTNGLALDATLTGGTQKTKLIDSGGTNVATVSAAGAVKVDGSAVTQPVSISGNQAVNVAQVAGTTTDTNSGAKSAGTQRVVLATDQPQLTNALKVDGSGVTQPISGTITANQGGSWTATVTQATASSLNATVVGTGTFAVQAAQSGNWTARVVGNSGGVADGVNTAATAPANGFLGLGIYNSTEPSPTTGQSVGLQLDSKGRQRQVIMDAAGNTRGVNVTSGNALTVDGSAVTQPISGTVTANQGGSNWTVNLNQVAGSAVNTGNGTASGSQRVAVASDNTPFQVSASAETSTVFNGTTALTPTFATVVASASGATSVVAAVSSKKIRVLALQLVANGAVNVKWQSHTTPTDLTGLAYLAANGGYVLPFNPAGWFQTNTGEQLDINLSGAVAVGGCIVYVAV